jgi:hypothetical protein
MSLLSDDRFVVLPLRPVLSSSSFPFPSFPACLPACLPVCLPAFLPGCANAYRPFPHGRARLGIPMGLHFPAARLTAWLPAFAAREPVSQVSWPRKEEETVWIDDREKSRCWSLANFLLRKSKCELAISPGESPFSVDHVRCQGPAARPLAAMRRQRPNRSQTLNTHFIYLSTI